MSVFPDWQKYAVHQRREQTGCIPTCYEMLLRTAGVKGIDFRAFQDEFDLDINLQLGETARNNFESVARVVEAKYPFVKFEHRSFATGNEKTDFIDDRLVHQQPVVVSLSLQPFSRSGWHIMPVVDATDEDYVLLWSVKANMKVNTKQIKKAKFAHIHDNYTGGDDVAFVTELKNDHSKKEDGD